MFRLVFVKQVMCLTDIYWYLCIAIWLQLYRIEVRKRTACTTCTRPFW